MGSRIGNFAARLVETGWLAAVMVVPIFFDVWSSRVFEPDKLTLLRSLALLILAASFVVWGQSGMPAPTPARIRAWLATPLVAPVVAMTAAIALSTALSRLPALSVWGSYNRLQGLYTWSAYVVLFGAIVLFLRDRAQLERLVLAIILPSLPIALYAVVQRFGQDPMPWLGNVTRRVASTMGNSIFVAAYLIMVVPLTWVRLVQAYHRLEADESTAAVLRLAGYIVMAVVQILAIVLSQSRGPFLGLLAGLALTLLLLLGTHRRALRALLAVGAVLAAFLVVFNLPGSPLAPLRDVPYIGRLGQILQTESGTGKVRVLIWGGAKDLFLSDPTRMIIGHGPETMHIVYNPFYPAELGSLESRNASPDRSHNETWDTLVQTGALGLLAYLFLYASVFYVALRALGLIAGAADRNRFLLAWFGGGAALAGAFVALEGVAWFGVALPLGMVVGLGLYVVYRVVFAGWTPPDDPTRRLLLIGILGGIVAHFVEIHFGIAIAATRTLFFTFLGLLAVVGTMADARPALLAEPAPVGATSVAAALRAGQRGRGRTGGARRPGSAPTGGGGASSPTHDWLAAAMLLLVTLCTLAFDFIVRAPAGDKIWILLWLLSLSWLLGGLVVGSEAATLRGAGARGMWSFVGVTLAVYLGYIFVHRSVLGSAAAAAPGMNTSVVLLLLYYGMLLALLVAWAAILSRELPVEDERQATAHRHRPVYLYPLAAIAALILVFRTNVDVVRADIWYKNAFQGEHERATSEVNGGQWDEADQSFQSAVAIYDRAIDLAPHEDYYFLFKGKALLERADAKANRVANQMALEGRGAGDDEYADTEIGLDAQGRDQAFEEAMDVLMTAYRMSPLNTDHSANLGRAYQIWGDRTFKPDLRSQRLAESVKWFEGDGADIPGAIKLTPTNAGLLRELATTYYLDGQDEKALATIDRAIAVDPSYTAPLRLRATIAVERATAKVRTDKAAAKPDFESAQKDYEAYLESRDGRGDPTAWSGLALVRAQLGDADGAREANLKVLELAPGDLDTLRNLAILERDAGNIPAACGFATQGLAANPSDSGLQQLAATLGCSMEGDGAGGAGAEGAGSDGTGLGDGSGVTETAPAAP